MGLLSSGAKAAAKNAVSDAGLLSPGIRAYHGSPHNFDQFSSDAIGTGEGAQAYGRGLYFAENEDVARGYRDKSAKGSKGSMYEVKIKATPDEVLDWDALLDDQPQAVLDKLQKTDWYEYAEEGAYERANARGDNPTGADLLRWLEEDGAKEAALALEQAGLKGIKYADAYTRHKSKGKQSSNYVVLNPSIIEISRKYGVSVPVAAAMMAQSDDADAGFQSATMKGILGASKISPKANRKNLLAARTMLEEGVEPRVVYEETGYFRAADGKMRFETPDPENIDFEAAEGPTTFVQSRGAGAIRDGGFKKQVDISSAVDQYPAADLMFGGSNPPIRLEGMQDYHGYYDPNNDSIALNETLSEKQLSSTLAHELQHAVQRRNNFAPGGNPDAIKQQIDLGLLGAQQPLRKADLAYNLSIQKMRGLSGIAAASKYRKYSLDSNLTGKRRLLVGNSHWYEHGDKIRQDLGPEPKRHRPKAEKERWLSAAWEKLADFVDPLDESTYAQLYDMSQTPRGAIGDYVSDGLHYLVRKDDSYPVGIQTRADLAREQLRSDPKLAEKQIKRVSTYLDSIRDDASEFTRLKHLRNEIAGEPGYEIYKRSAGEVEARNVQTRLGMTQDERYASYPPDTEDVPRSKQILNQNPSQASQKGAASPAALAATAATGAGLLGAGQFMQPQGGMGVRSTPAGQDEQAFISAQPPTAAPSGGLVGPDQNDYGLNLNNVIGMADAGVNAAAGMIAPVLSAPGAVARYAADRYIPGVNFSADDMANARKNTESFFDYQPKTQQGQQFSNQGMQALGGLLGPVANAADDSYIINAFKKGFGLLDRKEQELLKALTDMSPI